MALMRFSPHHFMNEMLGTHFASEGDGLNYIQEVSMSLAELARCKIPSGALHWLVSAAILLSPALGRSDSGTGVLAGSVSDAMHGTPLAGAEVRVPDLGLEAVTGKDGCFQFEEVAPGIHKLIWKRTACRT
jgi:hypothetical protein